MDLIWVTIIKVASDQDFEQILKEIRFGFEGEDSRQTKSVSEDAFIHFEGHIFQSIPLTLC